MIMNNSEAINNKALVDALLRELLQSIRSSRDVERAETRGLEKIRNVKMQLYFKEAFANALRKCGISAQDRDRAQHSRSSVMISKEEYLRRLLGKPVWQVAEGANVELATLLSVIASYGHKHYGRRTLYTVDMMPWFMKHIPDRVPEPGRFDKRRKKRKALNMLHGMPRCLGYQVSSAYGREGNFRRLLHTRSHY